MTSDHLATLKDSIPRLARESQDLCDAIPHLDEKAVGFSATYNKTTDNPILQQRERSMLLARNVDKLSDVLELPTLLSTAVSTSPHNNAAAGAAGTNYSSALDLFAHIKRLQTIYPESPLIKTSVRQAEMAMKGMASNLIVGLRTQNIRLAAAMRTVGWLRRVSPELEDQGRQKDSEGAFGSLFLVCRLANLVTMLEALDPLRELADQETQRRLQYKGSKAAATPSNTWSGGQQTERYLKRYIEIFREQSFAIVSLYKNIFPASSDVKNDLSLLRTTIEKGEISPASLRLQSLPPVLSSFPMHLVGMLADTLRAYLPNVQDRGSRESLLTQVLYCAGSLGRLGGDFSFMLTTLEGDDDGPEESGGDGCDGSVSEWEDVMKKHRALSGRLEQLTHGGGGGGDGQRTAVKV